MGLFDAFKRSAAKPGAEAVATTTEVIASTSTTTEVLPLTAKPPPGTRSTWSRKRVLFVSLNQDSVPADFAQLGTALKEEWDTVTVQGADKALAFLSTNKFDAAIIDVTAGSPELAFANQLNQEHGTLLRFLRCDAAHRNILAACTGSPAVQPISRESNSEAVASIVHRAFRLDVWLSDSVVKALVSRMQVFPSLPSLYTQVNRELQSPTGSLEFVARLIAKDPVMAAKVLQAINSVVFGLAREISDPMEAVLYLGAERTKSMILLAKVISQFDSTKCAGFSAEAMWQHSMATGAFAQSICLLEKKDPKFADTAFTAGLLHDIGKVLLAGNLSDEYSAIITQASRRKVPVRQVEQEVLGTTHTQLAAALLGTWGLPLPILEAIAWHHEPAQSADKGFTLLTAVHVANILDHEKKGAAEGNNFTGIDADYLDELGLRDRRNPWRERCGVKIKVEDQPFVEKMGPKAKAA